MNNVLLKDVCFVKGGKRIPLGLSTTNENTGYRYMRLADCGNRKPDISSVPFIDKSIYEKLKNYKVNKGDVYLSVVGTIGICGIIPYELDGVILTENANKLVIKNKDILNNEFLYYLLSSSTGQKLMRKGIVGSIQPKLPIYNIELFEFNLPGIITQQKIATILSALDSKIEINNGINAELEAMAKTLYDYWFVQFDFPDKNSKPYKTSGGKMIWNEELKREIPEGWDVAKMADWILTDKSGDWGKEELEGNFTKKVTCIRGADINGLNGLAELKPPVRYILEKNSSKILNSHDLIIEISGGSPVQSTGRIAFITDSTIKRFENPLICSNFCKPISIKNKKLLYNFVYYWKSLYDAGIFFGYEGKTSGIKNLLFDSFVNSYYTVVPDDKIVDKFYNIMENIQEKKQTTLAENQQLSELRDWLLPMLMNGQVTVGDSAENKASYKIEEEMRMAAEPGE